MNILFITHSYPNYVPDLLLHGLRKLMGSRVVDYPKKECLYRGVIGLGVCPENQLSKEWFPPDDGTIDREEIFEKVNSGFFEYVICDVRAMTFYQSHFSRWAPGMVIIDGEDKPARIKPGYYVVCRRETDGSDFSIPLPMALPEEILRSISAYDGIPKEHSIGFLGSTNDGERKRIAETISRFYPDALLQTSSVPSGDNPSPDGRYGREDYYAALQKCRIVLSLAGAGYDTFRFWENAACNAVHVAAEMPLYIPNDFAHGKHIFRFFDIDGFRKIVDTILENKVDPLEITINGRYHLVKHHLTTERATYFLDRIKKVFNK